LAKKQTRNRGGARSGPQPVGSGLPAWAADLLAGRGAGRWLVVLLAFWVLLAVLYPGQMFEGLVFRSSDAANAEAFATAGDAALADGSYPLWNPYLFAGMPTFGSLAYTRYLYPPTTVFNFLQNDLGFVPLTWMLAHLLFGGMGMAWLLSRWKLPVGAMVLGGLIWLLFPKVVAWGVHGHGSKLIAAMYLPWIVGWTLRICDGAGIRAVGMTGLLLGLQLLIGHVQITYYTLLAAGWLVLWNTVAPFEEAARRLQAAVRWRRFGLVLGALALGFAIGGIMLVPAHDYASLSIRGQDTAGGGGVGLDYATGWSLAPDEMGTFIMPAAAGFGKATYMGRMPFTDYPNYFGVLLLVIAAAGWIRGGRGLFAALAVMSLLAVMVAWGGFGFGLYELLYAQLPFFNKFRIPSMILILVAFALAVLAARGAAAWREGRTPGDRPRIIPAVLAALGLIFLLAGALSLARGPLESSLQAMAAKAGRQTAPVLLEQAWLLHRASLIRIGLVLLTGAGAFWFSLRNENFRRRGLVWALVILVGADLMAVNRMIVHPERNLQEVGRDASGRGRLLAAAALSRPYVPRADTPPGPQSEALAAAVGHDRVWPLGELGGRNLWMADGIRSLGGYHPAKLARFEQIRKRLFGEQPAGRLASWLAGTVVAFNAPFQEGDFELLESLGCRLERQPLTRSAPFLYRNGSALPRARLVTAWQPVASLPEKDALEPFLDGIQAGDIPVGDVVYLDRTPAPAPESPSGPLPAPIFVRDGMNETVLQVDLPAAALLLLADMMAPGWSVQVDGQDRDLLTADLVLRAVALEAGAHTVRFHYRDPAVRAGLTLTLAGAALAAALLALSCFRRPQRTQPGDQTDDA